MQKICPSKMLFYRFSFSTPSPVQTHSTKHPQPSQKPLQAAQIVLISLNFHPKTPNEHKKIFQALYQYLKDLMFWLGYGRF